MAMVSSALNSGAKGFVSKSADPMQILQAIKKMFNGGFFISNDLASDTSHSIFSEEKLTINQLTTKEFEIFKMLAEGKSITTCAQVLNISEKTANNYQTSVREKLNVKNAAELVHLALRNGIIKSFN